MRKAHTAKKTGLFGRLYSSRSFLAIIFVAFAMVSGSLFFGALPMHFVLVGVCAFLFLSGGHVHVRAAASDRLALGFVAFWLLSIASLLFQYMQQGSVEDQFQRDAFSHSLTVALMAGPYFLFGAMLRFDHSPFSAWLPLSALFLLSALVTGGQFAFLDYRSISTASGIEVLHFDLSDAVVLLAFFSVACTQGWRSIAVALLAILTLFFIQGRTALYLGSATLLIIFFVRRQGILFIVCALASAIAGFTYFTLDPLLLGRIFTIGTTEDGSAAERALVMEAALPYLGGLIVVGDFQWAVRHFGASGYYVHNGLSYWMQYGLLIFGLGAALLGVLVRRAAHFVSRDITPFRQFALMYAIYAIASVFFAKAFVWNWIWFAVGLHLNALQWRETQPRRGSSQRTQPGHT
jgi:hypothetical protein